LPGKLLDIPKAKPALWNSSTKFITIAMGAAMAAALTLLACCTCWFFGLLEVVPVKQEGDAPKFPEPEQDSGNPAVKSREDSFTEGEGGILVIY
jgi:hypothetical protein